MTFTLLFVCTGNICRSPMAEHLARAVFSEGLRESASLLEVTSAGTWGHEGSRMEPEALQALSVHGIDGAHFRARELTTEMVSEADLVLTAAREHDVAATALSPGSRDRIFGLTEFARLVGGLDLAGLPHEVDARARALVRLAGAARDIDGRDIDGRDIDGRDIDSRDIDVPDPYGAPARVFAKTATHIRGLLEPLVAALAAPAVATPGSSPNARAGMVQP